MLRTCIALTLLGFVTTAALAAERAPSEAAPADKELAQRFFQLGAELYNRADYAGALKQFEQAYRHSHAPGLLFNIGRCQESMGQLEQAIASYEAYLKTNPADKPKVEARLSNLRPQLAAREAEKQRQQQALASKERETATLKKELVRTKRENLHTGSLPGWILAGSGAAVITAGAILGGLAAKKASDLENLNNRGQPYDDKARTLEDQGKAFQTAQVALLIAGAAATIAGGTLLFFHYRKRLAERRTPQVSLAITPQGSMLTTTLRF